MSGAEQNLVLSGMEVQELEASPTGRSLTHTSTNSSTPTLRLRVVHVMVALTCVVLGIGAYLYLHNRQIEQARVCAAHGNTRAARILADVLSNEYTQSAAAGDAMVNSLSHVHAQYAGAILVTDAAGRVVACNDPRLATPRVTELSHVPTTSAAGGAGSKHSVWDVLQAMRNVDAPSGMLAMYTSGTMRVFQAHVAPIQTTHGLVVLLQS